MLRSDFYENAHDTPRNRRWALIIVLIAALSHMLGYAVILIVNRASTPVFILALLFNGASVVAGYYFWTFTIWKVGQWMKPIDPTYGDLLSPLGFAYAPQILNFLTLIPLLGTPIEFFLALWGLLAVIVAIRQALDIRTRQAALISVVGFLLIQTVIGSIQILGQQVANWVL
ncbi:hypothetical protein GS601_08280 [Myxacorys almedinensis A]|uniref:Yip1 domain-containing protein n=2 Tax=Myxacorys TaxID=2056239 RepID=A0A8J7YZ87_9CYAN|nr:YIP1 family protein [Myxacorys almedinensis]NDJ17287.1 hypothetical protein [Myxacorys almedinensis A]